MSALGPFQTGVFNGQPMGSVTVDDRKSMVRDFDRWQCFDALKVEGLQTEVRAAICRRLRQLTELDNQAHAQGVQRSGTG